MLNPFFFLYLVILLFFLFGVFAVIYHLYFYGMNRKFSSLVIIFFAFGASIFFIANLFFASRLNWEAFNVIF